MCRRTQVVILLTLAEFLAAGFDCTSSAQDIRPADSARFVGRQDQASVAIAPLQELVNAMPDGREIVKMFKNTALTVDGVNEANRNVETELSKIRSVETELGRVRLSIVSECEASNHQDISNIKTITTKAWSLDRTLLDIDARLKKAIDVIKRRVETAKPSIVVHITKAEILRFENAYSEYGRLRVSAHATVESLDSLAQSIPATLMACQPVVLGPLFGGEIKQSMGAEAKQMQLNLMPKRTADPKTKNAWQFRN